MSPGQHEQIRKSWAVPLTGKCTLFHGHCAALVSLQYHYRGWELALSQQAGGFLVFSTQLHFNPSARLRECPLSPDLWNGDICGPDTHHRLQILELLLFAAKKNQKICVPFLSIFYRLCVTFIFFNHRGMDCWSVRIKKVEFKNFVWRSLTW